MTLRKNSLFILLLILLVGSASAQTLTNFDERLYKDLDAWETQGFIRQLPLLKPYSGITLQGLLNEAEKKGTQDVRDKVAVYRKRFLSPLGLPNLKMTEDTWGSKRGAFSVSDSSLQLRGMIGDYVHFDAELSAYAIATTDSNSFYPAVIANDIAPMDNTIDYDYRVDKTTITLGSLNIAISPTYHTILGIGLDYAELQMGYSRTGFLDFDNDSIVLSPSATASPQVSFTWRTQSTVFSSLFEALGATEWNGEGSGRAGKYINFSSFQWKLSDLLEFDAYQSVVYGQRIELGYFVPGLQFLQAEMYDNTDNMLLGTGLRYFLPNNIKASSQIYLDDFTIVKFLAGKFDTRFKAALDGNIQWNPTKSFIDVIALDYTMVLPYTYTHVADYIDNATYDSFKSAYTSGSASNYYNYLDYTSNGQCLGSNIGPNSDRIKLLARFFGPANSTVLSKLSFTRHGNASEGTAATVGSAWNYLNYVTQGSVFDPGYNVDDSNNQLFDSGKFLAQKVIQMSLQATFGFQLPIEFECWTMIPQFSATAEWYWNRNLVKGDNGFTPYFYVGGTWLF